MLPGYPYAPSTKAVEVMIAGRVPLLLTYLPELSEERVGHSKLEGSLQGDQVYRGETIPDMEALRLSMDHRLGARAPLMRGLTSWLGYNPFKTIQDPPRNCQLVVQEYLPPPPKPTPAPRWPQKIIKNLRPQLGLKL